jgi:hypothetical protein
MISSPIRLTVLYAGGIAIAGLLVWGVFGRSPKELANVVVTPATTPSPALTNPQGTSVSEPTGQNIAAQPEPTARAIPSSSPGTNGLPLGVTKEATEYNKEVYAKLPGVKPPVINTDGRNLGPEAIAALQASRTPVPFPGTNFPAAQGSVSPIPFPQTLSDIQRVFQPKLSPSPEATGN